MYKRQPLHCLFLSFLRLHPILQTHHSITPISLMVGWSVLFIVLPSYGFHITIFFVTGSFFWLRSVSQYRIFLSSTGIRRPTSPNFKVSPPSVSFTFLDLVTSICLQTNILFGILLPSDLFTHRSHYHRYVKLANRLIILFQ